MTSNNVALGMARREIRARVLRDPGCAEEPGTPPRTLMMACGAAKFTAMFTDDDRAWSIRTSLDATGRAALVADGRGRLAARYGPPTAVVNDGTTLIWTARPMPAAGAQGCWLRAGLLAAAREAPSGPLPRIDPGCLPLRYAIVAGSNGHAGLIVEQQDPAMGLPRAR